MLTKIFQLLKSLLDHHPKLIYLKTFKNCKRNFMRINERETNWIKVQVEKLLCHKVETLFFLSMVPLLINIRGWWTNTLRVRCPPIRRMQWNSLLIGSIDIWVRFLKKCRKKSWEMMSWNQGKNNLKCKTKCVRS